MSAAFDRISTEFMDKNAFVKKNPPLATYAGQNDERFMNVLKEQGVTVAMRHMKG